MRTAAIIDAELARLLRWHVRAPADYAARPPLRGACLALSAIRHGPGLVELLEERNSGALIGARRALRWVLEEVATIGAGLDTEPAEAGEP